MRYRQIDSQGDYLLGRRDSFLTGAAAVGQAIQTRLLLLFGEWWENREDGLPLFEKLLGVPMQDTMSEMDLILSERIATTKGVKELKSFDSNYDAETRSYTASCVVETDKGEIVLSVRPGQAEELLTVEWKGT